MAFSRNPTQPVVVTAYRHPDSPYFDALNLSGPRVPANSDPTDITYTLNTITEASAANSVLTTLTAVDADVGDTHTFTKVAGAGDTDNGIVEISGNQILITDPSTAGAGSKSIRIRVTDQAGGSYEEVITFNIVISGSTPVLTPSVVSYNMIDLSWSGFSAIFIEQATSPAGPWTLVGFDVPGTNVRRVTRLEQDTNYYFRARFANAATGYSDYSPIVSESTLVAAGTEYHVAKTGNDTTGTGAVGQEFLSINRALSAATTPGDIVTVHAGTYSESTAGSTYVPTATVVDSYIASCAPQASGTLAQPITIRVAPGEEGSVILDCGTTISGFHMQGQSFCHFYGWDISAPQLMGIGAWEQSGLFPEAVQEGVVADNNYVHDLVIPSGHNGSGISPWSSKDWIIRNNRIWNVTRVGGGSPACIQSYKPFNCLVEFNDLQNSGTGIMWKHHYVANASRDPIFESEIRFNFIKNMDTFGIFTTIKGASDTEAGDNYWHHNILIDCAETSFGAIGDNTGGAFGPSGLLRVEHNLVDGLGAGSGIGVQGATLQQKGNITTRLSSRDVTATEYTQAGGVESSDYNIFDVSPSFAVDKFGAGEGNTTSLATWQSYLAASYDTLLVDNPDTNSATASHTDLFVDADAGDYSHKAGSPALAFMSDGSNAGPYQTGYETIGLLNNTVVE